VKEDMINNIIALLSLVFIMLPVVSYADDTPKIVISGMEAYKTSGFEGAFAIWLKGSPLENDKTTMTNLKGAITQIEATYGKMKGYEVLRVVKISTATTRTYAEIRYEKGPLFLYVDCYKTATGFVVPMMRFHTEADKLLPEDIFKKSGGSTESLSSPRRDPVPPKQRVPRKTKRQIRSR